MPGRDAILKIRMFGSLAGQVMRCEGHHTRLVSTRIHAATALRCTQCGAGEQAIGVRDACSSGGVHVLADGG